MFPWKTTMQSARSVIRANFPVQFVRQAHAPVAPIIINRETERMVTRDRTKVIPADVSISYMESDAYKRTYGNDPIWKTYQRNFKGHFLPRKTRKTCIRNRMVTTSNPCPICRDEYLVVDYKNTKLLKQFISEHTGEVLDTKLTSVCQRKHNHVAISILKAKDLGLITFDLPVRMYDYSEWYKPSKNQASKLQKE